MLLSRRFHVCIECFLQIVYMTLSSMHMFLPGFAIQYHSFISLIILVIVLGFHGVNVTEKCTDLLEMFIGRDIVYYRTCSPMCNAIIMKKISILQDHT